MTATPSTSTPPTPAQTVELAPSYLLPFAILLLSVPVVLLQRWVGLTTAVFAVFLIVQAATIRLRFTATTLEVYRSGQQIRNFPYAEWSNWRVFWPPVPILFYFREVKSIHFLPMLFDPSALRACLEQRCPVK
ncbi:protein of unknown function (DUF3119) [Rubidibacter lacunae KORDI 51-2]|uniref:Glycerol dehydrogenase n=1 Tax=Rubidibacter lacunae KORDI 51-2 TaxID=582515 RepID=U5DTV1_9CHRO|nr:DUF3119 family protein [Rubidibacter lacunae]ERN43090.1 protein of unknown function (DUF3119) [Rubidibacter lacunae KORDI 51-2]